MTKLSFEIELEGRQDRNGHDYYVTLTKVPVSLDLSDAVLLVFPWEDGKKFGAKLVVKRFEPRKLLPNGSGVMEEELTDAD